MSTKRIIFQNWIIDSGYRPNPGITTFKSTHPSSYNQKVIAAVRKAMMSLKKVERTVVVRFYFEGQGYRQISIALGEPVKRVMALQRRAVNKLRRSLAGFVTEEYGIKIENMSECVLCNSKFRNKIDRLILGKKKEETWKRIVRTLKTDYNIIRISPQVLIAHRKYHL